MNKKENKISKEIKINKKSARKNYSNQTGITLIALVVTIVVLLILAGVSINAIFSENGIIKRAQDAQNKMDQAAENDQKGINELSNWLDSKINGNSGGNTTGGNTTGENDNPSTTTKISTLVGTVVDKNTKAEDAYGNKITIPKGFKVVAHGTTADSATYTYSGDNIPAVQDGIVIENGTDGNQFVWVPVGTIKNKDNTTNTITLGRYSNFTKQNGNYVPAQTAENYTQETVIPIGSTQNQNYTIARLGLEDEKESTIKINKAIQLEGMFNDVKVIKTAPDGPPEATLIVDYKELTEFRSGNTATDSTAQNATARDLETFISTTLANGGYYIARFEASGTASKITSKYSQTVLTSITQPNAAKLAREMYGEIKENNKLVYASDLVNSYAWDTAIVFIQTYSGKTDYASHNESKTTKAFTATGKNNDKYCNIWDMSGNAIEWTTEYSTYSNFSNFAPCVTRGGHCYADGSGAYGYTSLRISSNTTVSNSNGGLRPLLYVK